MHTRKSNGSVAVLAFVGMVPLVLAIGAVGADMMHFNSTRGELQKACDAGALAGANQLYKYYDETPNGRSAIENARTVAGTANPVDGRLLVTGGTDAMPGNVVNVNVTIPEIPNATTRLGGRVRVEARIRVRSLLAHIVGHSFDTVSTFADAGPSGTADTALRGSLFPMVVGITDDNGLGQILRDRRVGDPFTLRFKKSNAGGPDSRDNDQNTAWTSLGSDSANANRTRQLIAAYRNPSANNGHGAVTAGTTDINLQNGVVANVFRDVAGDFTGKVLVLPVVESVTNLNRPGRVIGFFGLKVTGSTDLPDPTITGVITYSQIYGINTENPPVQPYQQFFSNVRTSPVRLLQ